MPALADPISDRVDIWRHLEALAERLGESLQGWPGKARIVSHSWWMVAESRGARFGSAGGADPAAMGGSVADPAALPAQLQ